MKPPAFAWLVFRAWYELARYDVLHFLGGFNRVFKDLVACATKPVSVAGAERSSCEAVVLATCLYWKPVRCLQRSVCATRMLRAHGVPARLVIGYREAPFLSHAWVEVDARVVNDSPAYQKRLRVLYSM